MPRYLITLGCQGNPWRKVSHAVECDTQTAAEAVAARRLAYARNMPAVEPRYDYWQVLLRDNKSNRTRLVAAGKAEV